MSPHVVGYVCMCFVSFVSFVVEVYVGQPDPGLTGAKRSRSALSAARSGWCGERGICGTPAGGHLHVSLAPGTLRGAVWAQSVVQHYSGGKCRAETHPLQQITSESTYNHSTLRFSNIAI